MREKCEVPEDWEEPAWLKPYNRGELAWLADQQHKRNQRLQIENRELRLKLQQQETTP